MSLRRTAAKRDSNEPEIIQALKAAGCTVVRLSAVGCPDLLVGIDGLNFLIEVKEPKGKLTEDQVEFHEDWRGQVAIVRTIEEALEIIGR